MSIASIATCAIHLNFFHQNGLPPYTCATKADTFVRFLCSLALLSIDTSTMFSIIHISWYISTIHSHSVCTHNVVWVLTDLRNSGLCILYFLCWVCLSNTGLEIAFYSIIASLAVYRTYSVLFVLRSFEQVLRPNADMGGLYIYPYWCTVDFFVFCGVVAAS